MPVHLSWFVPDKIFPRLKGVLRIGLKGLGEVAFLAVAIDEGDRGDQPVPIALQLARVEDASRVSRVMPLRNTTASVGAVVPGIGGLFVHHDESRRFGCPG